MSNQLLRFFGLAVVALTMACTKYTVAPDAGDAGDAGTKADRPSTPPDAGPDQAVDQTGDVIVDQPGDVIKGCPDPTRAESCGDQCVVCPVPMNADHATCDGKTCGVVCKSSFHACESTCVDNNSVNSCGSACKPCQTPTGGTATCDGQACGMSCPNGTALCGDKCIPTGTACNGACSNGVHSCGGTCRSDSDINFCGASCEHCTAPQNGMAICNGACGAKCNSGFNLCGTSCKAATDSNFCGPNCIHCDAPTGGSATCDGMKCGAPTCPNGQKDCNNACIDNARSCNGVCSNGKYNCPDGVCRDTNTVMSCGTACQSCPAKPNATATSCTNGACGYTCNAGYIQCVDGTCSRSAWNFETGDSQGWYIAMTDDPPDATAASMSRKFEGSYALTTRAVSGVQSYRVVLAVPICNGKATNLNGKKISMQVYSDLVSSPDPSTPSPYLCPGVDNGQGQSSQGCSVGQAGWTLVEKDITSGDMAVGVGIEIYEVAPGGASTWSGHVYVDDVRISN